VAELVVEARDDRGDRYWLHAVDWCRAAVAWTGAPHGSCPSCEHVPDPGDWQPMLVATGR
jgi:hypothetical protein